MLELLADANIALARGVGAAVRPRGAGALGDQAVRRPPARGALRRRGAARAPRFAPRHHRHTRHLSPLWRPRHLRHGAVRGGRGGARACRTRRRPRAHVGPRQLLLARSRRIARQSRRRLQARPARARLPRPGRCLPLLPAPPDLGQGLDEERRPGRRPPHLHQADAPCLPPGHHRGCPPGPEHGSEGTRGPPVRRGGDARRAGGHLRGKARRGAAGRLSVPLAPARLSPPIGSCIAPSARGACAPATTFPTAACGWPLRKAVSAASWGAGRP